MGSAKSMSAGEVTELLGVATRRRGTRSPSAPGTAARAASPHREKPDAAKSSTLGQFDPVAEAFAVLDPTGSGFIDAGVLAGKFNEICAAVSCPAAPRRKSCLARPIDRIQPPNFPSMLYFYAWNATPLWTRADIMATLLQSDLTPQDAAVLVKAADKDGDGRVSLADFRSMLASSDSRKKSEFGDVAADDKPADDDD